MSSDHFIVSIHIQEVTFPEHAGHDDRGRAINIKGQRELEDIMRYTQKADNLEGAIVAAQAHLDVVLGVVDDAATAG